MTNRDDRRAVIEYRQFGIYRIGDAEWVETGVNPFAPVGGMWEQEQFAAAFAVHRAATILKVLALFDAKGANLPTRDDVAALLEKP